MSADEIDRYMRGLDEAQRSALKQLRGTILALLPEAEQGLSYGVPAFSVDGRVIAGFSAAKNHLSYLPHSGSVLSSLSSSDLEGFSASKGALKFSTRSALPADLVAKLIDARVSEIAG